MRDALFPPKPPFLQTLMADPAVVGIAVSAILAAVVLYTCNATPGARPFRASTTTAARHPGARYSDRSELQSWNIQRLLKPFSPSR